MKRASSIKMVEILRFSFVFVFLLYHADGRRRIEQCRPGLLCPYTHQEICGSDGKTYKNSCFLLRQRCISGGTIRLTHTGPCGTGRTCQQYCPLQYNPICGSDGKTYSSDCMMNVLNCLYRKSVTKQYRGKCSLVGKTCGVHCSSTRRLICGTDGKTYSDECSFEQEKCRRNKRLKISYYGTCRTCQKECRFKYRPVCGSDGETYINECQLSIITCKNRNIVLKHIGSCGGQCSKSCTDVYNPICASNDKTYNSLCHMDIDNCKRTTGLITKKYDGTCLISSKVCVLPKGSPSNCGEGRRSRRYFYNFKTGRCESFVYNGCGGNSNNFMDRQECEVKCVRSCPSRCSKRYQPVCGNDAVTYISECFLQITSCKSWNKIQKASDDTPSKVCVLPKSSPINCREGRRSRRYFYNFKTGICESFIYNGCGGNSNNFRDRQQCNRKCRPSCPSRCSKQFKPVCCNDDVTYNSDCFLKIMSCKSWNKIQKVSEGRCSSGIGSECARSCSLDEMFVCGSDGVTYPNDCHLSIKTCESSNTVTKAYSGRCRNECARSCSLDEMVVCGSDGLTYLNDCYMSMKTCKSSNTVTKAYSGRCMLERQVCMTTVYPTRCRYRRSLYTYNYQTGRCKYIYGCYGNINTFQTKLQCEKKCKPRCAMNCHGVYTAVCGSDLKTYQNSCFLNIARCKSWGKVQFSHNGVCGGQQD